MAKPVLQIRPPEKWPPSTPFGCCPEYSLNTNDGVNSISQCTYAAPVEAPADTLSLGSFKFPGKLSLWVRTRKVKHVCRTARTTATNKGTNKEEKQTERKRTKQQMKDQITMKIKRGIHEKVEQVVDRSLAYTPLIVLNHEVDKNYQIKSQSWLCRIKCQLPLSLEVILYWNFSKMSFFCPQYFLIKNKKNIRCIINRNLAIIESFC